MYLVSKWSYDTGFLTSGISYTSEGQVARMASGTRSRFTGALWFPVCWLGEWLPWRPFRFGSIWKGWMCREGLKEESCVEGRALSDNRKRMGRRFYREAGQGVGLSCCKKGGVGGNSPNNTANTGILTYMCSMPWRPPHALCSKELYPIFLPGKGQKRARCHPCLGYELFQKVKRQVSHLKAEGS